MGIDKNDVTIDAPYFTNVTTSKFIDISCGDSHSLFLDSNFKLFIVGRNNKDNWEMVITIM